MGIKMNQKKARIQTDLFDDSSESQIIIIGRRQHRLHSPRWVVAGIYYEYPRQQGKPRALIAIDTAITRVANERCLSRNEAADFLLERTKLFAEIRNGDIQFIKYPATWFNESCYYEDSALWKPSIAGKQREAGKSDYSLF